MANKEMKTLKNLSKDELSSKARELEAALFQIRMKKATGQLSNLNEPWKARKELARVKTLEKQKTARN
jgi:large subunit ribosomal protein L29